MKSVLTSMQDKSTVDSMLEQYKMANKRHSSIRLNSMACVALPTCGLAFAESERYPNCMLLSLVHGRTLISLDIFPA